MRSDAHPVERLKAISRILREDAPGLSTEDYRAFLAIAETDDGVSLKDVQGAIGLPQSTTSRLVAKLARGGLIDAETDPESRRKVRLKLSERGRALLTRLALVFGCLLGASREDLMGQAIQAPAYLGSIATAETLAVLPGAMSRLPRKLT